MGEPLELEGAEDAHHQTRLAHRLRCSLGLQRRSESPQQAPPPSAVLEGFPTEATGANEWVVRNGTVLTPDAGCLLGITRQSVFDLCAELGVSAKATPIHRDELDDADEVFLTTTAGSIMPARSLDGRPIGGRAGPGELSVELHNRSGSGAGKAGTVRRCATSSRRPESQAAHDASADSSIISTKPLPVPHSSRIPEDRMWEITEPWVSSSNPRIVALRFSGSDVSSRSMRAIPRSM